jgi:hypothetical protein
MIDRKQCHAIKYCRTEWCHIYDRASRVGAPFIRQLGALGLVKFGTPPGWDGECYTATNAGCSAIREYEAAFGPLLKD